MKIALNKSCNFKSLIFKKFNKWRDKCSEATGAFSTSSTRFPSTSRDLLSLFSRSTCALQTLLLINIFSVNCFHVKSQAQIEFRVEKWAEITFSLLINSLLFEVSSVRFTLEGRALRALLGATQKFIIPFRHFVEAQWQKGFFWLHAFSSFR